jgi:probable rRNA maturation factor
MKIIIKNNQNDVKINISFYKKIIKKLIDLRLKKIKNNNLFEIYINFVSKEQIKKINFIVFKKKYLTDVISVPIDTKIEKNNVPKIFGEIFICPFTAKNQCIEYNNSIQKELILLIIHGFLHLLGYDDIKTKDIKIMRKEEQKMLEILGF